MNTPKSIPELITKWPNIGAFAADIGCGYEAARQMKLRESIAPRHWSNVVAAANRIGWEGVTFEWLAEQKVAA